MNDQRRQDLNACSPSFDRFDKRKRCRPVCIGMHETQALGFELPLSHGSNELGQPGRGKDQAVPAAVLQIAAQVEPRSQ